MASITNGDAPPPEGPATPAKADVDRFLHFVVERQKVADRRAAGEPRPWSDDPIISERKFCMVIRDDDRTSREAREIILALPERPQLQTALTFRLYNKVPTLVTLRDSGVLGEEDSTPILRVLEAQTDVFSRAYKINIRGPFYSKEHTARALAQAARVVRRGDFTLRRSGKYTAEAVQGALDINAPFCVGQIVQDLRWIGGHYDDEGEWCVIGPGAARGLARLCGEYGEESEDEAAKLKELEAKGFRPSKKIEPVPGRMLPEMTRLLAAARDCAALSCRDRVTLATIQHSLCETDKYARIEANPKKGTRFVPHGKQPAKRSKIARRTASDTRACATATTDQAATATVEAPREELPSPSSRPVPQPPSHDEAHAATATEIESVTPETAARLFALFGGARANRYRPSMTPPDEVGKVKPIKVDNWCEPPTVPLWEEHLRGEIGLGIIPPGEDNKVRFGAIDVDDYQGSEVDLSEVVDHAYRAALPLVPVRTKSDGRHLLMFAAEPVEPALMERALRNLAARLNLKLKDAGGKTEIITTANLWMPHAGGSQRCGIKQHGFDMVVDEFLRAAEAARLAPAAVAELAKPRAKTNGAAEPSGLKGADHAAERLAHYCDELAAMRDGDGRDTHLNKSCFAMGTMIGAGWIDRSRVESDLTRAATACGYDPKKLADKLKRSIDAGSRRPPPRGRAIRHGSETAPWRDIKDKFGNPAPTLANAVIGIKTLGIGCRLDLFHHVVLVDYQGDLSEIKHLVGELTDDTLSAIRSLINNQLGLDVGDANALAAVKEIARNHAFDPVLDYLAEVQGRWDRMKRIDTWLTDYCGAPDTPFTRAVARKHLVASVRRARKPGCKYDDILVMESPEGKNKSTAIMVLAGKENFSDQTILGVEDRVAQELMTGVWLYEIADLTDIAKADVNRVKAFASRDTDRARPVYARVLEKRPRRCTLWATTNDQQYLKSQTGNRRFLPVPVGSIDLDRLRRDRDQLWAEAAVAEANNESIMLDESLWATATEEQEQRRTIDPWEDILANIPETINLGFEGGDNEGGDNEGSKQVTIIWYAGGQERVASADLLTYVLRVPVAQQTTAHGQRLAIIMQRLGWQRPAGGTLRVDGAPVRGYCRSTSPAANQQGDLPLGEGDPGGEPWRRPDSWGPAEPGA